MKEKIVILGAGMAGYGAAKKLDEEKLNFEIFEKNNYYGGHCASFKYDDWVFDDGPHISFTKDENVKELFADNINQDYCEFKADTNNYWKGQWITHPAQVNLNGLPPEFVSKIIVEMIEMQNSEQSNISNYQDWLYSSFGKTFSDNFPAKYTKKFHTTEPKNLTTDWIGKRLYRPKIEEVIYGALCQRKSDVHYIKGFRYPRTGGFVRFMDGINKLGNIRYDHQLKSISLTKNTLEFKNGNVTDFTSIFSSLPLREIILMIDEAPKDVIDAANKLAWTQCLIVNLGVKRPNVWQNHWTYFYDEDFFTTRLSCPSLFSPETVPPGCSSLQIEIYFSDKYKPFVGSPDDYIPIIKDEMIKCGILNPTDEIPFSNAWLSPYAQVIFDHDRKEAVKTCHDFLDENKIYYGGRYADWAYIWSDESYNRGKEEAEKLIEKSLV